MIKTENNIKSLISTGLYETILGQEDISLTADQKLQLEQSQGIFGTMLENADFQRIADILKPRMVVKSGSEIIDQGIIEKIQEPIAEVEIVGPKEFAGNIMALAQEYRGQLKTMEYLDETRVVRKYHLPMGEIIIDFYDRLKSATKGYATMNYEFKGYEPADLVKLDIFINNEKVEALTRVVHKDKAYYLGREVVEKLKTLIPKQLFPIPLQA
jgi:GTP-binding protein LepA